MLKPAHKHNLISARLKLKIKTLVRWTIEFLIFFSTRASLFKSGKALNEYNIASVSAARCNHEFEYFYLFILFI